jgi:archaellum component FlaD/FlaE
MILHNWFETLEDIQKGRGEKTKEKGQKMPEKELGKRDVKQEIELIEDKEQEIEEIILSKTETPLEDQVHLTEKEIGEIILSKTETPLEDQVHLTEEEIKKIILSEIPLEDQVYITEESMKTLLSIFTSDPKHDSSHIL